MAKLSKEQQRLHQQACALVDAQRPLTEEEREFILLHWQESSTTANSLHGAFFTPLELAYDMMIEVEGKRIIDLGAGIGHLAWAAHCWSRRSPRELVCVETNPEYVRVGQRVLPEATWICADAFDLPDLLPHLRLGRFDCVISNPPFRSTPRTGRGPRYRGPWAEYHFLDLAADLADYGVFVLPAASAPFRLSGPLPYAARREPGYEEFRTQTGITLSHSCGIDTCGYRDSWRGVRPRTEIVLADFTRRLTGRPPAPAPTTPEGARPTRRPPVRKAARPPAASVTAAAPAGEQMEIFSL